MASISSHFPLPLTPKKMTGVTSALLCYMLYFRLTRYRTCSQQISRVVTMASFISFSNIAPYPASFQWAPILAPRVRKLCQVTQVRWRRLQSNLLSRQLAFLVKISNLLNWRVQLLGVLFGNQERFEQRLEDHIGWLKMIENALRSVSCR